MKNISISNNDLIRLTINNDDSKVIEFDPTDFKFVKGLQDLRELFQKANADNITEIFEKSDVIINKLFGAKATEYLFNNKWNITAYREFITQIVPFVKNKRDEIIAQYTNK